MRQFDLLLSQTLLEYEFDSEIDKLEQTIRALEAKSERAKTQEQALVFVDQIEELSERLEKLKDRRKKADLFGDMPTWEADHLYRLLMNKEQQPKRRKGNIWRKLAGRAKDAALAYLV